MSKELTIAFIFLCSSSLLTTIDVMADLSEGTSIQHVSLEVGVIVIGIVGALLILRRFLSHFRAEIRRTQEAMIALQTQADQWRAEAHAVLQGLAVQIDRQFTAWSFSKAEKEVALLLIKGLSTKDIANIRGVHEKTIRLQASALYKKSSLSGRAELAAFFLEDLLLPPIQSSPD